jgi:hypothetical protein
VCHYEGAAFVGQLADGLACQLWDRTLKLLKHDKCCKIDY